MQANQRENKIKTVIIDSPQQKLYALSLVGEMPVDGTGEVVFKKVDLSSTAKQRRLRWLWNTEISHSGLGRHDTKEGVDLGAKWQFGKAILLRDDDLFGLIYNHFMKVIKSREDFSECCRKFASQYISVENMTRQQVVEYLSEFQRYWIGKGVELSDPASQGLDLKELISRYS